MTISCADCGSPQIIPPLPKRSIAECYRCDRILARHRSFGILLPFSCAVGIVLLLPASAFLPLMQSSFRNILFEESRLVSSVAVIYNEVWFPFAFGFLFLAFLFPFVRAALQIIVLGAISFGWPIPQIGRLFRWSEELRKWSMTEVVVIGGIIAFFRAAVPASVSLQIGGWLYITVALMTLLADWAMDRREIWGAIHPDLQARPEVALPSCDVCELIAKGHRMGEPCPRCGEILGSRVEPRFVAALTAAVAAIPLCIPAFSTAVMVNNQLTGALEHTVVGTIQLLADHGFWAGATVMFIAGIIIPIFELAALLWLTVRVRFPASKGLVTRTRIHRLLRRLMRWPMILPFTAAIAAPIVNYRGIDDIIAGPGATPLFMVIALLILGIHVLEPRLMWRSQLPA